MCIFPPIRSFIETTQHSSALGIVDEQERCRQCGHSEEMICAKLESRGTSSQGQARRCWQDLAMPNVGEVIRHVTDTIWKCLVVQFISQLEHGRLWPSPNSMCNTALSLDSVVPHFSTQHGTMYLIKDLHGPTKTDNNHLLCRVSIMQSKNVDVIQVHMRSSHCPNADVMWYTAPEAQPAHPHYTNNKKKNAHQPYSPPTLRSAVKSFLIVRFSKFS